MELIACPAFSRPSFSVNQFFFSLRNSNVVGRINEVTLRQTRLVSLLGWVMVFVPANHLGM